MRNIIRNVKPQKLAHGTCTCIRTCVSVSGTESIVCYSVHVLYVSRLYAGKKSGPGMIRACMCVCTLGGRSLCYNVVHWQHFEWQALLDETVCFFATNGSRNWRPYPIVVDTRHFLLTSHSARHPAPGILFSRYQVLVSWKQDTPAPYVTSCMPVGSDASHTSPWLLFQQGTPIPSTIRCQILQDAPYHSSLYEEKEAELEAGFQNYSSPRVHVYVHLLCMCIHAMWHISHVQFDQDGDQAMNTLSQKLEIILLIEGERPFQAKLGRRFNCSQSTKSKLWRAKILFLGGRGKRVTSAVFDEKANHFATALNQDFKATNQWLCRWKTRHGIKFKKAHREKRTAIL